MESIRCPLCGDQQSSFLFSGYDRMHGFAGEFPVHQCGQCHVVFLARKFTPEQLSGFYPQTYYAFQDEHAAPAPKGLKALELKLRQQTEQAALAMFLGYPSNEDFGLLARFNARRKLHRYRQFPRYRANGRLLDVGCGSGDFLQKMKAIGWDVYGVEPGEQGALAGQKRGLNIFHGTLEQAEFPDAHFDFIRFEHVLEHVPDPVATLREARRILRPGGQIRLMVPNWNSWPAQWFKSYWYHLDTPRHLFWFTPETLAFAAQRGGLKVSSSNIFPDYSDIADSLIYLLEDRWPSLGARMKQRKGLWKLTNRLSWPLRLGMRLFSTGSLLEVSLVHADSDGEARWPAS